MVTKANDPLAYLLICTLHKYSELDMYYDMWVLTEERMKDGEASQQDMGAFIKVRAPKNTLDSPYKLCYIRNITVKPQTNQRQRIGISLKCILISMGLMMFKTRVQLATTTQSQMKSSMVLSRRHTTIIQTLKMLLLR